MGSMKKLIGYTMFWFGIGMLFMLCLTNICIGILLIILLLLIGFILFDVDC